MCVSSERDARSVRCLRSVAVAAALASAHRPPSMAELQSFLLTRKRDPTAALDEAHAIANILTQRDSEVSETLPPKPHAPARGGGGDDDDDQHPRPQSRRRVLSTLEVDKMVFNPQDDWEHEIGKVR